MPCPSGPAERKPEYELHDLTEDPHEATNLANESRHADTVHRLSTALDDWLHRVGDLGEVDEDVLIAGWRPGGRWRVTKDPDCTVDADGVLTMTCATPGALIGWATDVPLAEARRLTLQERINGDPEQDGRNCTSTPGRYASMRMSPDGHAPGDWATRQASRSGSTSTTTATPRSTPAARERKRKYGNGAILLWPVTFGVDRRPPRRGLCGVADSRSHRIASRRGPG
jgi:hypothetical protein